MKQVKSRYNYDPALPLSKEYQDSEVFNAYYKCFDAQTNSHYLLSHFKTENKTQIASLFKKFTSIQTKMQQGLNSKYLAKIHDVFLTDKEKSLFLIMDFSEGGSIIDYIGKIHTLEPKAAVRIILGALSGLLDLHKHDILNCFINLENIEIDQNGVPKLSFKCMIYKTIYLSPEFRKEHVKSQQSDFYCLGVCLYRLIYGVFPFKTQKIDELIDMVKRGPQFQIDKEDGMFPILCPKPIRQILSTFLNINPDLRWGAVQKMQQYKFYLQKTSQLSRQIYLKFFNNRYINYFVNVDESDSHEFSILDHKEKKLLKIAFYKAPNNLIDSYLKDIVTKFAKLSGESFLKIYEYQIIQQEFLALVFSHYGQGNLAEYARNSGQNFSIRTIQHTVNFLKNSLKLLEHPYRYLNHESICIKNGNLRIRFPEFQTRKHLQNIKQLASSGKPHFIAPQILAGQQSKKCDSWSVGVIQYWMIYNQLPTLDSRGTLVPSKKQKLSKEKLLYFHNVIEKNPNKRLNIFNQDEIKNRLISNQQMDGRMRSYPQQQSPQEVRDQNSPQQKSNIKKKDSHNKTSGKQKNDIKNSQLQAKQTHTKLYGIGDQSNSQISAQKPQKIKRQKKKDLALIEVNSRLNPNILPNQIQNQQTTASKYKNPIVIQTNESIPQKNSNKFSMKMFSEPEEIKTPQKALTIQKSATKDQSNSLSVLDHLSDYTIKVRSRFASLQRNYTKSVRISIKCFITIIIYLFLFYLNFFKTSGSLIGSRQMYEAKIVHIRAFSSDSRPSINYTLVTKTPSQTYQLFYNTTVPVLRDEYKCVLNDYSVKSDVALIIKSEPFVAYQVIGFLIALLNMLVVCVVIARYDICKVCHVTNFDEKKYHTLINYGMIILSIVSLTSLHYLIYGGLYHLMLEPCLGKSTLPGLQFLMKNWTTSWIIRFIWAYLGIAIAYVVIIFFLIKPLKKLNKYLYLGLLTLYLMGVGIRGIGKGYPAHQNVFGVCGQLLALILAIFLFFTDLMFACFIKSRAQQNNQKNIDMRSIEDFNKTEEFFIGDQHIEENYNQK